MEANRKVYAIGETVLDIIFRDGSSAEACPGGSMLNSAVSLGRCGIPVEFISDFGNDQAGKLIGDFLYGNKVSSSFSHRFDDGKTAIALAFLDPEKNASYSFYKDFPVHRLTQELPVPAEGDIVLFGSFFAVSDETHEKVLNFVRSAKQHHALIIYDPNFRRPHLPDLEKMRPRILQNIACADIVRASDEDMNLIFSVTNCDESYATVKANGCQFLIYTRNKEGISIRSEHIRLEIKGEPLEAVSTIGAGDAFNAGLIFSIYSLELNKKMLKNIEAGQLEKIAETARRFASDVCMSMDNYISTDLVRNLLEEWRKYQN